MKCREEVKAEMKRLISNLKSMAEEYEKLYSEMDNMTDEQFECEASHIEDIYSEYGIELF